MLNTYFITIDDISAMPILGIQPPDVNDGVTPDVQDVKLLYSDDGTINFNGDYLEFKTPEAFLETLAGLKNADGKSIREWASHFGFTSMYAVFEKALEVQEHHLSTVLSPYLKYSPEQLKNIQKPQITMPAFIKANEKLFHFDEEGLVRSLRIFHSDMAHLVNSKGIVKVAGHLFQYNEDNIKIIIGGDAHKLHLLDQVAATDEMNNIVFKPVVPQNLPRSNGSGRNDYYHQIVEQFTNPYPFGGKLRTIGTINLNSYSTPIYGSRICDSECNTPIDPNAKVAVEPCNCYYPIVGYNYYTVYETHMEVQERILWVWKTYRPKESEITVHWHKDGVSMRKFYRYTRDLSNTYGTIYNGPMINVTRGNHSYSFNFWPEFDGYREVSDSFSD